jgi:hypothetical protein
VLSSYGTVTLIRSDEAIPRLLTGSPSHTEQKVQPSRNRVNVITFRLTKHILQQGQAAHPEEHGQDALYVHSLSSNNNYSWTPQLTKVINDPHDDIRHTCSNRQGSQQFVEFRWTCGNVLASNPTKHGQQRLAGGVCIDCSSLWRRRLCKSVGSYHATRTYQSG